MLECSCTWQRHRGGRQEEKQRGREDGAICRTKADWPEAASGPAVTPATEKGMGEKGWGKRKEQGWSSAGCGTLLLFEPDDHFCSMGGDKEINKQWAYSKYASWPPHTKNFLFTCKTSLLLGCSFLTVLKMTLPLRGICFFSGFIGSRTSSSVTGVSQIWRCSSRRYGCIIDTVPPGHISCSSKRGGFPAFHNHQFHLDTEWGQKEKKMFLQEEILQGWSWLNCYPYWSSGDHAGLWWIIKPCNYLLIRVFVCVLCPT